MENWKKDYYQILQVSPEATTEVINSAFKILASKYHPGLSVDNAAKFNDITEAYQVLCNPSTRNQYDNYRRSFQKDEISSKSINSANTTEDIQSFISFLYEKVNNETFNHNVQKSKTYEAIYNSVVQQTIKIEISNQFRNPLWKILKTYENDLEPEEFDILVTKASKLLKVPKTQAEKILANTEPSQGNELPINKFVIASIVVVILLGLFTVFKLANQGTNQSLENTTTNTQTADNIINSPDQNQETSQSKALYTATIVDIGSPVNIRRAPTTQWNNIVDKIKAGESVEVIKHEPNGWYYIKKGNIEGYIYAGLVENNNYIGTFPVAIILNDEMKVVKKDNKVFKVLKKNDRLVVGYQDGLNYYLLSEKGNLIGIKKEYVSIDNKQNSSIPFIDDTQKASIEYFAIQGDMKIVDDKTNEEEANNKTTEQNTPIPPKPSEHPINNQNITTSKKPITPPIIQPKQGNTQNISQYIENVKQKIIKNWNVPSNLPNYGSVVTFRIDKNGNISNVKLQQSSGNQIVDQASVNAVKSTGQTKNLPDSYNGNYIDVRLNFDDK